MTALLPAHRRAEKFATLVDATSTTDASARDAQFLEIVGALRSAAGAAPAPRADYVADLRSRLMAEADTALVPTDRRLVLPQHAPRRQNRLTAAAAALVIVGGTAGMSVAAQGSLPGDALYPVKRGIEQVNETFSFSDAARGEDMLHQADARLGEVDLMLAKGASDQAVAESLRNFATSAGAGADLLFRSYQRDGNDDSVSTVRDFAGTDMGELTDLAQRAPVSLQAEFAQAAQLLAELDQQARVLCAECGARDPLSLPNDLQLAASAGGLDRLLDLPAGPASAANVATIKQHAARAARPSRDPSSHTTAAVPKIVLPDLDGLLGDDPAGTTQPKDGKAKVGVSSPLGGLLDPKPSSGSSSGVDLGKVGETVKRDLGKVTDPLLKP